MHVYPLTPPTVLHDAPGPHPCSSLSWRTLQHDLPRCLLLSSLWHFLCNPSSLCVDVCCVCVAKSKLFKITVQSHKRKAVSESYACLASVSWCLRSWFRFCYWTMSDCLPWFLCVVFVFDRAATVLRGYQVSVGNQDHRFALALMTMLKCRHNAFHFKG